MSSCYVHLLVLSAAGGVLGNVLFSPRHRRARLRVQPSQPPASSGSEERKRVPRLSLRDLVTVLGGCRSRGYVRVCPVSMNRPLSCCLVRPRAFIPRRGDSGHLKSL